MGVDAGQHVVEHHPAPPFHLSFDEANGGRLEDIKAAEEAEPPDKIRPAWRQGRKICLMHNIANMDKLDNNHRGRFWR